MATRNLLRGRAALDGRVVRGESRLVAAVEGASSGPRERVELTRGVLVTGADGQLGVALREEFRDARVVSAGAGRLGHHARPPSLPEVDLVLHAAAWTDVDCAETHAREAAAVNVGGTQHAAELGAPLVVFSTDYVFDGARRRSRTSSQTRRIHSACTGAPSCKPRLRPVTPPGSCGSRARLSCSSNYDRGA